MHLQDMIDLDQTYYMNTFGQRLPVCFTHGEGVILTDTEGKQYTDFLAGIATNALGYAEPGFTKAIQQQAGKILHCSNYFYIEQQAQLAQMLCQHTCADRVFFASTGAEANECAIKLARKYFSHRNSPRHEIITATHSFHGRTLATLAATGQEALQQGFSPLPPGFVHVPFGDLPATAAAIHERTAAIFVEPIQGEGGVFEGGEEYLQGLRQLCDEHGLLLIFDEVQTGMGRTGALFAHQLYHVEPDIFTSAKALGNGLPLSACLCKESAAAFQPGEHGTTFGGNPFCCTAGLYVMQTMTAPGFLAHVAAVGAYFKEALWALAQRQGAAVQAVRGQGLLLGAQLSPAYSAGVIKQDMLAQGFVIGTAANNTLRFVPPLIIQREHIDALIAALDEYFSSH